MRNAEKEEERDGLKMRTDREISIRESEIVGKSTTKGEGWRRSEGEARTRVSKPEQTIHTSLAGRRSTWKRC